MKKFLALCMVLLLTLTMVACGDKPVDGDVDTNETTLTNYYLTYNGVKLEVGVEIKDILPKLGTYTSEDGEACGTDEKDVIYTLSGLEVETHVKADSEIIRQIKILNDSQSTVKGITIGSSRDDVVKAYGDNYKEGSAGAIRYEGESSAIEFHFGASGSVSNIYIKRNVK